MGSHHDSSDGFFKIRPRLADVTNRPAKRSFSLVSGDGADSQFTKQMRLGVEGLAKSKIQMQLGGQTHLNDEVLLQPKENQPILLPFRDDTSSSFQNPGLPSEGLKEQNPLGLENFEFGEKGEGISPTDRAVESGDKDNCVVENLGSPGCGTVQMPSASASDDSNFPWLKPCPGHKADGASNSVTDPADLKSCSCSLCSKGGYSFPVCI